MAKLRGVGQSIIEYVVILVLVALATLVFLKYIPDLFVGYKYGGDSVDDALKKDKAE